MIRFNPNNPNRTYSVNVRPAETPQQAAAAASKAKRSKNKASMPTQVILTPFIPQSVAPKKKGRQSTVSAVVKKGRSITKASNPNKKNWTLRVLIELGKAYAEKDSPAEELSLEQVMSREIERMFKKDIAKEWAEAQYYSMKDWQELPPPHTLVNKMGLTLNIEQDRSTFTRYLLKALEDLRMREMLNKILKKWWEAKQ